MDFYMKLPRNKKEFALFMAVISIISVNIIAPLITCLELRMFSTDIWLGCYHAIPFIWLCVIALVLITYVPAEWLTKKIVAEGDSFRSVVTINILCTVLMMSVFLTVLGTWIGTGHISMDPIKGFHFIWPRNFAVSFAVEALIAQPIARWVLYRKHLAQDKKHPQEASAQTNA
ncbi:MAG: hypothetical protein IJC78_06615 [Clostridia bacterium]|nr:hypothetical protein [Clostridia bacterium]